MDNAFESVRELVGLENVERAIIRGREGPVQLLIAYLSTQRQTEISPMTGDALWNLNVVPHITPQLRLKPGYMARAEGATQIGGDNLWSSSFFHQHLKVLADFEPPHLNRSSRRRIEAFLFRVSAMVDGPDKQMVLSPGHPIPSTDVDPSTPTTFPGIIGYTVIIASQATAQHILAQPTLENISLTVPSAFFVAEAKLESVSLMDHIPQAVGEMYACLKILKKNFLRGALTSGYDWIFLLIELNPNGDGATYQHSPRLGQQEIGDMWPDLVAGVLHYWVEHGFTGMQIDNSDWFEVDLPAQMST